MVNYLYIPRLKNNKIEKDIINDSPFCLDYNSPFCLDPIDLALTSVDISYLIDVLNEYLSDYDISDDDRQYVENYLSTAKEISNQYETKYFEENGIHTEAYWFDYLRELITEE